MNGINSVVGFRAIKSPSFCSHIALRPRILSILFLDLLFLCRKPRTADRDKESLQRLGLLFVVVCQHAVLQALGDTEIFRSRSGRRVVCANIPDVCRKTQVKHNPLPLFLHSLLRSRLR